MRLFSLFLAIVLACPDGGAHAQEMAVDTSRVRDCHTSTPVGTIYPSCLGQAANDCQNLPGGSTTLGIVGCIQAETSVWDALLNEEYRATRDAMRAADAAYGGAIDRTEALLKAQRAWIAFRDADCAAAYARWQDGSIRNVVASNCHMTMTAARAIALRDMRGQ